MCSLVDWLFCCGLCLRKLVCVCQLLVSVRTRPYLNSALGFLPPLIWPNSYVTCVCGHTGGTTAASPNTNPTLTLTVALTLALTLTLA